MKEGVPIQGLLADSVPSPQSPIVSGQGKTNQGKKLDLRLAVSITF